MSPSLQLVPAADPHDHLDTLVELRAQVALNDRLASIGRLAGGVAHELNNPLAYITANLDWIKRMVEKLGLDADRGGELCEVLDEVAQGAAKMGSILRDLGTVVRARDEADGELHVSRVVRACGNLCAAEVKHRGKLV